MLFNFVLEITARCNHNCRHCYINLPASDQTAKDRELTTGEIDRISDEAVQMGAMWCLITGGEPLLRSDFPDIYMLLKRKGLLVSVFTNASLISKEHITLFKQYPPRDIEVTVYGVTKETYERVTRQPGSFEAFTRGLDLLFKSDVKVRLKAMAVHSNVSEMQEIDRFCRKRTKDYYHFDPQLHLRVDGNPVRNEEIRSERLSPDEIVTLERSDPERSQILEKFCKQHVLSEPHVFISNSNHLLRCGAGRGSFEVGYDGRFRLCSSLRAPGTTYDFRSGSLIDFLKNHVPRVQAMTSDRKSFLETCSRCHLTNLCLWCPAHAHLETGEMDAPVAYFCEVAHARAEALSGFSKSDDAL